MLATATPGSPVMVTVSGALGPWDASPFVRASLASKYGTAGYCKVESLTATPPPPPTTAITELRCYDATGAALPSPLFTFTHVTSDVSGSCGSPPQNAAGRDCDPRQLRELSILILMRSSLRNDVVVRSSSSWMK